MKINMMDNDNIHVLKIFMINDRAAIDDNLPPTNYFDKKHFTIFLTGKYFAPQPHPPLLNPHQRKGLKLLHLIVHL